MKEKELERLNNLKEYEKQLHEKGIPNEKIFATGIPLSNKFLLRYDKTQILESFGLSPDIKTVLFFGGRRIWTRKNSNI